LVRAGIIPLFDADPGWLVLSPLAPGLDPVGALARQMATAGRTRNLAWTTASVESVLGEVGGLGRLAADLTAAAAPARQMLIVVDQVEELLTRAGEVGRNRFAAMLADLPTDMVRIVATLRSEFLDPITQLAADARLPLATFCRWDIVNRRFPRRIGDPLDAGTDYVGSAVFSPDGTILAAGTAQLLPDGSYAGSVVLWNLAELSALRANLSTHACNRAGRGFTPQEWALYIPDLPFRDTCAGRAG
jgi:hypothetical protein